MDEKPKDSLEKARGERLRSPNKGSKGSGRRDTVEEVKNTCRECGHVWHYLAGKEKELEKEAGTDNCMSLGCIGCAPIALHYSKEAKAKRREAGGLKACPACNSRNAKRERVRYSKQE